MVKPINSKILQKSFPEQYRRFFSENELVISTAPSFMWTGEYSAFYGGISICQKVPFRVYAGLKPISEKKIVIEKVYEMYVRHKNKFLPISYRTQEIDIISRFINEQFGELISNKGGCQISFLAETSESESLNLLATSCALLSLILHLNYDRIEKKEIISWQGAKISQLKENEAFRDIFNLTRKINCAARDGLSSGTNAFMALLNSGGFPVIYWTEKDLLKSDHEHDWHGERLIESLDNSSLTWHFDFGLLQFGGWRAIGTGGGGLIKRMKEELERIKEDSLVKNLPLKSSSSLFAHYCKEENLWLIFMETLDIISFRILLGLKNVFRYGPCQHDFSFFLDTLNQHWDFFKILELDTPEFNTIMKILQKQIKKEHQVGARVRAYGLSQKGCLTFAVSKNSLVDKERILDSELKTQLGPDVYFSYLSWLDGTDDEGVKIEQDLKNKSYSPLVGQEEVLGIREYNRSFRAVHRLLSRSQLDTQKESIDLVLDKTKNQVYLRGIRLNSQKIRSARETIKIIDQLLKHKGELKNTALAASSYSANQYELSGKIILPLKRSFKEILKKELYLTVRGKIYDFNLRFDPTNLKILLVERTI